MTHSFLRSWMETWLVMDSVPEKEGWDRVLALNVKSIFYSMLIRKSTAVVSYSWMFYYPQWHKRIYLSLRTPRKIHWRCCLVWQMSSRRMQRIPIRDVSSTFHLLRPFRRWLWEQKQPVLEMDFGAVSPFSALSFTSRAERLLQMVQVRPLWTTLQRCWRVLWLRDV